MSGRMKGRIALIQHYNFVSLLICIIPSYVMLRVTFNVVQLLYLGIKAKQYFVSLSCTFFDKKFLLKVWLKPGLNLTVFRGNGPGEKKKKKKKKKQWPRIARLPLSMTKCFLFLFILQ